jgi:hypothetical protein
MITWRMAAGWVAALVVATVLAWQIVGLADSQVGEVTPEALAPSPTSTVVSSTTTSADSTTSTQIATTSTGSSPGPTSSVTTPTSSVTTPPTTAGSTEWSVRTINSSGGVVVVRFRPEEVVLQAATPASGFGVEVDDSGPPRVRVEFDNDEDSIRVEARWENGDLVVEVD